MNENKLLDVLKKSKKVLLIEPPYRRKYIPLGLAKISTFIKRHGAEANYSRRPLAGKDYDLVCITSLFTFKSNQVIDTIKRARKTYPSAEIIIGGIFASLMPDYILNNTGIPPFIGYSKQLDLCAPDYGFDWGIGRLWNNFSYVFTTRGCRNKCSYCVVSKIEPDNWINPAWKEHVAPEKPYIMISDNNLGSSSDSHVEDVLKFIYDSGKPVCFNNGFDCKTINDKLAGELGKLKYVNGGMRLAFDRINEDGLFQLAIQKLIKNGVDKKQIIAFILFNYKDKPSEAIYRVNECKKLGIRPFPEIYKDIYKTEDYKEYVGEHWTLNLAKTFREYVFNQHYMEGSFEQWYKNQNNFLLTEEDWQKWNL